MALSMKYLLMTPHLKKLLIQVILMGGEGHYPAAYITLTIELDAGENKIEILKTGADDQWLN